MVCGAFRSVGKIQVHHLSTISHDCLVSAKAPRCRFPLNPSQIKVVNPRNLKYIWSLVIVAFPFRISLIITYNITTYQHVSVISRGIHSRSLDFLGRVAAEFVLATAALEALRRLQKKMEWGREVEYAKMVVSWFMVSMFSLQRKVFVRYNILNTQNRIDINVSAHPWEWQDIVNCCDFKAHLRFCSYIYAHIINILISSPICTHPKIINKNTSTSKTTLEKNFR